MLRDSGYGSRGIKEVLRDNTYHGVVTATVTEIQMSFISALTMFITQTLDSTVSRRPTKVTQAHFRTHTATLDTAFGADWLTCAERKQSRVSCVCVLCMCSKVSGGSEPLKKQ